MPIKDMKLPILGHLAYSIVVRDTESFEVSTINLPSRRIEDYETEWRDDWWQPPYPNETMVWRCEENGRRLGGILHCQGYFKTSSAIKAHQSLCKNIERMGVKALNNRQFQTTKLNEERIPKGLIRIIERRTKGLVLNAKEVK